MGTYLVTGGCGFIGSHLCDALRAKRHHVRVLDDLSTGTLANLASGAEFVRADLQDATALDAALLGVDGVFHLAAIASVERGIREWGETNRVNLAGTIAVLDGVRRMPAPVRVVYASSAAVYGECETLPIAEWADKRPSSAYGADKFASELHARVATRVHGIPTVGLRFFNVYGPRQDPRSPYSGVISIFADRVGHGSPVTIYGDGQQTRDFVFVGDVVGALVRAMAAPVRDAEVFNVCSGRAVSVLDLAHLIADLTGTQADIRFERARQGEIRHSVGSGAAARTTLGLPDPTPLAVGLAQLIGGGLAPLSAPDSRLPTRSGSRVQATA